MGHVDVSMYLAHQKRRQDSHTVYAFWKVTPNAIKPLVIGVVELANEGIPCSICLIFLDFDW